MSSRDDARTPRIINHTAPAYEAMLLTSQNIVIKDSGMRGPGKEMRVRLPRVLIPRRPNNAAITNIHRILVRSDTEGDRASRAGPNPRCRRRFRWNGRLSDRIWPGCFRHASGTNGKMNCYLRDHWGLGPLCEMQQYSHTVAHDCRWRGIRLRGPHPGARGVWSITKVGSCGGSETAQSVSLCANAGACLTDVQHARVNALQRLIVEVQHDAPDYSLMCRLRKWTGSTATAVLFTGR